jgi:nucleoside-diphosphate-sugar epimerase
MKTKTLAEKAAWDFGNENKGSTKLDLVQLHVSAIKNKKASGGYFIDSGTEPNSFADAVQTLLDEGYQDPSTKRAPR